MFPKPKRYEDRTLLDKAHTSRCVVCGRYGSDPDHLRTKGSGGADKAHNIMHVCRRHHIEKGMIGISGMANKYPQYKNWLISHGWYFCEVRSKWMNDLNNK